MSAPRRTKVATGLYRTASGAFEVAVPQPDSAATRFIGGFPTQLAAAAYREACVDANTAGRTHPDRDEFLAVMFGTSGAPERDLDDTADLFCDDATAIHPASFRAAIRGVWEIHLVTSRARHHYEKQRGCTIADEKLGARAIASVTRAELDGVAAELAGAFGQSTVNGVLRVIRDAFRWAVDEGMVTHNPVGGMPLAATSSKPRRTGGEHRLNVGSMAWEAVEVLRANPGVEFTARQVAERMEAAGSRHAAKGVSPLARVVAARLRDITACLTVPQLQRVRRGVYVYRPDFDPCPIPVADRDLRSRRRRFTTAELLAIAKRLPECLRVMLWFCAVLGARGAEAMGARICDLDVEAGILRLRTQTGRRYRHADGSTTRSIDELKNDASVRNLPLPPTLVRWLVAYVLRHHGSDAWSNPEKRMRRIVVLPRKGPITEASLLSWEKPLAQAMFSAGVAWRNDGTHASDHDLRFNLASIIYAAAPELTRSAWLGHEPPPSAKSAGLGADVTQRAYTEVSEEQFAVIAERLELLIVDELDKLEVDDADLLEWMSTADAARLLGVTIDRAKNILGGLGVAVHDFEDLRWPLVRRAYRRDDVDRALADLDRHLGMPVPEFCEAFGLSRSDLDDLVATGELDVAVRYYRRQPGGPIARRKVVTISMAVER